MGDKVNLLGADECRIAATVLTRLTLQTVSAACSRNSSTLPGDAKRNHHTFAVRPKIGEMAAGSTGLAAISPRVPPARQSLGSFEPGGRPDERGIRGARGITGRRKSSKSLAG
jgi:hypothetical protein